MRVLIICRDSRADILAGAFPGHSVFRLEGDPTQQLFGKWCESSNRWKPVLARAPEVFELAVVHSGDGVLMKTSGELEVRIALQFSGMGFRDASNCNRLALEQWQLGGGTLELRLCSPVTLDSPAGVLSRRDVGDLFDLAGGLTDRLPQCCDDHDDRRDTLAAVDLLLQGLMVAVMPDEPWRSTRERLLQLSGPAGFAPGKICPRLVDELRDLTKGECRLPSEISYLLGERQSGWCALDPTKVAAVLSAWRAVRGLLAEKVEA